MSITIEDFLPLSKWRTDTSGEKWNCCETHKNLPKFIIDKSTGRKYSNEPTEMIRSKCALLALGTLFIHPIVSIGNIAYRILKIVSFSHYWLSQEELGITKDTFKERNYEMIKDVLRIAFSLVSFIFLEISALFGIIKPFDGRKLYASFERAIYGHFIMAPCFQPDPSSHAWGGDVNNARAI